MKRPLRLLVLAPLFLLALALMITHPPGKANAGVLAGTTTAVPVGSTTPVIVVNQGSKNVLTVCNTGSTNALYCIPSSTSSPTTTNWTILLPAAASTAGTIEGGSCWTSPVLQNPTLIGQSPAFPDQITCISNSSTTAQAYWR